MAKTKYGLKVVALVLSLLLLVTATSSAGERPTVALVLGGGSARGLSHIGLLKALEEGGIPIDYIVGTSMGSVVAGLYAAGLSAENLHYMISNINIPELFVPTIPPKGGFLSTDRFKTFVDVLTDSADIESLPIPFHTVVINLVTGEEETLSTGSLSTAILASMAIPAMFPPVRIGDQYYVDGGMKSLVPVEVAKDLGADLVIAIDVRRKLTDINHDTVLSNVQLTLLFLLAADTPRHLEMADIIIQPPVAYDSYMDYDRGHYFVQLGYESAQASIPAIRDALLQLDPDFPFTDGSPQFGYPDEEFIPRFWRAVDAAENLPVGSALSPRLALDLDGSFHTYVGLVAPVWQVAETPLFLSYSRMAAEGSTLQSFGVGAGMCRKLCATAFVRRGTGEASWGLGASLEGRLLRHYRYDVEWEGSGEANGAWSVRLRGPERADVIVPRGEVELATFRDLRGLYGLPSEALQGEMRLRYYVPWTRADFWEAVSTSTSWVVAAGARFAANGGDVHWQPVGEAGIAFEARLFGLYPLRSRVLVEYRGGEAPWAVRWTLGNW